MVYPGEAEVNVVLDPGDIACLQMTKESCTVLLEEDGIYRVKVIQTNTVGATVNDSLTFNCECKTLFIVTTNGNKTCYFVVNMDKNPMMTNFVLTH